MECKKENKVAVRDYEYILFDLDGTLTDPKEGITKSVAYALEYFGIEVENLDSLCKFIGPPLKESFEKYFGIDVDIGVEKYRERFCETGLYENVEYEGIAELLSTLKDNGKTLMIATSKPHIYASKILEHFDLIKYFSFVSGSEMDGVRTDKAEVIAYALNENGIEDRFKVLMIGDREHDIIGANKNGVDSVGVLYGYGCREEFEENHAAYIVETVEELKKLLLG